YAEIGASGNWVGQGNNFFKIKKGTERRNGRRAERQNGRTAEWLKRPENREEQQTKILWKLVAGS
ncbi:MAG TPA: hypothetical protein PLR30_15730, partial [Saprospiraceae bacterium]|nr:hypothetical protein [Saprospiraceae bacterium]